MAERVPSSDGGRTAKRRRCKGPPVASGSAAVDAEEGGSPRCKGPPAASGSAAADAEESGSPRLLRWLAARGGFLRGVRAEDGPAGRRLVAASDLPAGFVLARVPPECALSAEACAALPSGRRIRERFSLVEPEALAAGQKEALEAANASQLPLVTKRSALYVALAAAPAEDSAPFGPLLAELRGCAASTPFTWAGAASGFASAEDAWGEIPALVAEEWRGYLEHLREEYRTLFPTLSEAFPQEFPTGLCSEAAWLRAHSLYTSRALPARPEALQADELLVPFLDRFNHESSASGANVQWRGIGLEEDRGAVTTRPVAAGAELLLSYGCKGNAELALGYGFAMWGNPYEGARLRVDVSHVAPPGRAEGERALKAFEAALTDEARRALRSRTRGPGSVAVQLAEEDAQSAPGAGDGAAWAALLRLCGACDRPAQEVLREVLMEAVEDVMSVGGGDEALEPEAWERHIAKMRAGDSVLVGMTNCAGSPAGVAAAMRDSQASVLMAALCRLADEEEKSAKPSRGLLGWCSVQ